MSLTFSENGAVNLSKERAVVCQEVAFELESLAFALPGLAPNNDEDQRSHYAVRGVAGRLLALSHVLMSALGDKVAEVKDLEKVVFVLPCNGEG